MRPGGAEKGVAEGLMGTFPRRCAQGQVEQFRGHPSSIFQPALGLIYPGPCPDSSRTEVP